MFRNTIYNLLASFIPALFPLLCVPYLLVCYGPEQYGLLALAWTLLGYANFLDLGLGRAITQIVSTRVAAEKRPEAVMYVLKALVLVLAASALACVLVWLGGARQIVTLLRISPPFARQFEVMLMVLAVATGISVATSVLRGMFEGLKRFGLTTIMRGLSASTTYLGPLIALSFGASLTLAVILVLAGRAAILCAYVGAALPFVRNWYSKSCGASYRILLSFGGWLTISNLVSPIMATLDRFLVAAWISAGAVAYYATAQQVVGQLLIAPIAVTSVLFPELASRALLRREAGERLYQRATRFILAGTAVPAIALLASGGDLLGLWLGSAFDPMVVIVLQWLTIGAVFNGVAQVAFTSLQSQGRPDVVAGIHLVEVPIYLAAVGFFASRYGIVGVAAAWSLRAAVDMVLLMVVTTRVMKWRPSLRFHAIVGLMAAFAAAWALGGVGSPSLRAVTGCFLISIVVAGFWWSIFTKDDRQMLLSKMPGSMLGPTAA
jgi:O-antigen/teichoic acid export membrane protein